VRFFFDIGSGYAFGAINEKKLLRRIIFLETVAGIPGMVAGSIRHLRSLRRIQRDMGWIHTLLEEAENERMHLLAFKQVLTKEPGILMKSTVWVSQVLSPFAAPFLSFPLGLTRPAVDCLERLLLVLCGQEPEAWATTLCSVYSEHVPPICWIR
jgi:hypothetical protein